LGNDCEALALLSPDLMARHVPEYSVCGLVIKTALKSLASGLLIVVWIEHL